MYKMEKTGKGRLSQLLSDQTSLDSLQIEKSISLANNIILKALKEEVMKGNMQDVLDMINSDTRNDHLSEGIFAEVMVNLISKIGVDRKNARKGTRIIFLYLTNLIKLKTKSNSPGNIQASNLFDVLGINKELHLGSIVNRLDNLINYGQN